LLIAIDSYVRAMESPTARRSRTSQSRRRERPGRCCAGRRALGGNKRPKIFATQQDFPSLFPSGHATKESGLGRSPRRSTGNGGFPRRLPKFPNSRGARRPSPKERAKRPGDDQPPAQLDVTKLSDSSSPVFFNTHPLGNTRNFLNGLCTTEGFAQREPCA
jgi:hypothetical protein